MKKTLVALLLAVASLTMVSCDSLNNMKSKLIGNSAETLAAEAAAEAVQAAPVEAAPAVEVVEAVAGATPAVEAVAETAAQVAAEAVPEYDPYEERLYSNAYDGYVNVRQGPSTKTAVLGRLHNGSSSLVKKGVDGNWYKVDWYGTDGYVHKNMVGTSSWPEVYLDVEADWFQGKYSFDGDGEGIYYYYIFNNGKFAYVYDDSVELAYGTWRLEGNDILLTTKYVTDNAHNAGYGPEGYGNVERLRVSVSSGMIGSSSKEAASSGNYWHSKYQSSKKNANKFVSL